MKNLDKPLIINNYIIANLQFSNNNVFLKGQSNNSINDSILTGTLKLKILKNVRLVSIILNLKGNLRIDWPENVRHKFKSLNLNNFEEKITLDKTIILKKKDSISYLSSNYLQNNSTSNDSKTYNNTNKLRNRSGTHSSTPDLLDYNNLSPQLSNGKRRHSTTDMDDFNFIKGKTYLFNFEFIIPQDTYESIKVDYGNVNYQLNLSIEKFNSNSNNNTNPINNTRSFFFNKNSFVNSSIWKNNLPIQIIRTQRDIDIDEMESIQMVKNWKESMIYDISIASKNIILDGFIPIKLHLIPLDKIDLTKIKIFIMERVDYKSIISYDSNSPATNKKGKFERQSQTKSYLLCEHSIREHSSKNDNNKDETKRRKYKNLLQDDNGDLMNKVFEFDVFLPRLFNSFKQLHTNTTFSNINVLHWIKIEFVVGLPNLLKKFEVTIDTPITVLNKLCSHANTLLPSYIDSCLLTNNNLPNKTDNLLYHESNNFYPKELFDYHLFSDKINCNDILIPSIVQKDKNSKLNHARNINDPNSQNFDSKRFKKPIINSFNFDSNIYQPLKLSKDLSYPQALPMGDVLIESRDFPPSYEQTMKWTNDNTDNENTLSSENSSTKEVAIFDTDDGLIVDEDELANIFNEPDILFDLPDNTTLHDINVLHDIEDNNVNVRNGNICNNENYTYSYSPLMKKYTGKTSVMKNNTTQKNKSKTDFDMGHDLTSLSNLNEQNWLPISLKKDY